MNAPDDEPIELDGIIYRRADREPFFGPHSDEEWEKIFAASRGAMKSQRKPPKPTLDSVAEQARKAGIPIASIEIKADGSFTVIAGKPELAAPENPWPLGEAEPEPARGRLRLITSPSD